MDSNTRTCQNCKNSFVIGPDDFGFYDKMGVPSPTFCPDCRLQRRMLWRNERTYYRRVCDLCKKSIIAVYPVDAPFPVYCQKCWWSDAWDPYAYGQDYDLNKSFFEQYRELQNVVPALAIMNDDGVGSVNSEYSYDWAFSKNIYMCVCGWHVENSFYSYWADYSKDIMDCWGTNNSELVYDLVECDKCFGSKYCTLCFDCTSCTFGFDLRGCSDCTLCAGLRNKRYCILNQQYSKAEYEEKLSQLNIGDRASLKLLREEFRKLVLSCPHRFAYNLKTTASTGDFLREVKNSRNCFYVMGPTENCAYIYINDKAKDSYDCNSTGNAELCYESVTPDNSRGNKFSIFCWKCTEAEYSNNCHSCTSVFGSTGVKHGSYVILNKRYSKAEYAELRDKIIESLKARGEWGEFFPHELCPFSYNESAAQEWFPLSKSEAINRGFRWKDIGKKEHVPTLQPQDLPATIAEVGDDIVKEIIKCAHAGECNEKCTEAFRIVPYELVLYRKMDIPLPTLCPNCRHYERLARRNPPRLWHRRCQCTGTQTYQNTVAHTHGDGPCGNEFETSYSPDRPEIVYCEACYNSEIA